MFSTLGMYIFFCIPHGLWDIYDDISIENIQSIHGGKVNILGGHSVGHSKQRSVYMYMCPIPNTFRDRDISHYSSKTVDKKEILRKVR
jgi:hypothetical protein